MSEEEKKTFWDSLDEIVNKFSVDQRLFIGGDLNGHIGTAAEAYLGIHKGFGYRVRKEEGRSIHDFPTAHVVAIVNSFFKKRDHHLITFHSGVRFTQIDYLMVQRGDLKKVKLRREGRTRPRILWKNINGDAAEAFRIRVAEGVTLKAEGFQDSDADCMWDTLARISTYAAKETLVEAQQARFEELLSCREDNQRDTIRAEERAPKGSDEVNPSILPQVDCYYSRISQAEERVIKRRLRRETMVSEDQFGFMPGRSSIEAIHLIRSLIKKYRERYKDLHMAFLDLEKANDSVPWELIWKTLIDKGTPRRYIRVISNMYAGVKTQ
ncbi:integrator complex subunit 11, partial [Tanacetum coccineum]